MKTLLVIPFLWLLTLSPVSKASEANYPYFTDGQLAQILAPIALYPDTLLTHILISSTYPVEVIEAYRWLENQKGLTISQKTVNAQAMVWDPSIKALLPFPAILKRLHDDLSWTQQLGYAFLGDETRLLSSIQQLRRQADNAGTLAKMDNMVVNYEDSNIVIQPKQREIVYVPYYDSRVVYGNWYWSDTPPIYWQHTHIGYHQLTHFSPFYWQSGVRISFNYFFGAFHWHNRQLVVINHHNSHHYVQRHRIVSSNGTKRWHHQPQNHRSLSYNKHKVNKSPTKKHYQKSKISTSTNKVNRHISKRTVVVRNNTTYSKKLPVSHTKKHNRQPRSVKQTKSHKQMKKRNKSS
jgi:hypothetical protein